MNKKMTIMVVAPGHSLHTKRFLATLLSQGHKVVAVCEKNPFPEKRDGFSFIRFPLLIVPLLSFIVRAVCWVTARVWDSATGDKIRVRIESPLMRCLWLWFKPDLVYLLWVDFKANICLAGGLRPLVLQVWGSDVNQHFQPGANSNARERCGRALSGADLIIYDAPDMKDKCETLAGHPLNMVFIHFGVDTTFFSPQPPSVRQEWRERFHLPEDALVFLSARAWHPKYRHHDILEVFVQAQAKLSRQTYLVFKLYNGDNSREFDQYKNRIVSRAETLGVSDKVIWVDEMSYEELPNLYAMSDVVINYPVMDALGITLMEAAACNRRIITIDLPCYKGTFVEKYSTMVRDLHDLENAMVKVANELPAEDILLKARNDVEKFFDSRFFIKNLDEVNKSFFKPC